MKLYIHTYERNAIIVTPVQVKETDKLFKIIEKQKWFPGYRSQISKEVVGHPSTLRGYHLIDLQPQIEYFKSFIEHCMKISVDSCEANLVSAKNNLEQLKTVDVIIKRGSDDESTI